MKAVWLSALHKNEAVVQKIMSQCKQYGLAPRGHFWENDTKKMAWLGPKESLMDTSTAAWVIWGSRKDFEDPQIRYGLSMLAICVQARRGSSFPLVLLQDDETLLTPDDLPTPLKRASVLAAAQAGTPAKLVAKIHTRLPEMPASFFIDMVGSVQFGQWFEIRPVQETWPGIIFGLDEGDIRFQAVGPAGKLPDKTTLEYAMQGLTLEKDGITYTAWAVRNEISTGQSYYVKIDGTPGTILFGGFSDDAETELYAVHLK